MSHVAESVSIVGVGKVAGQVEVNALLHGVEMLLVRLSQQNSAHFDSQKTLEALCLLPLLKKGRQIICNITVGGNCPPHTHYQPRLVFQSCQCVPDPVIPSNES